MKHLDKEREGCMDGKVLVHEKAVAGLYGVALIEEECEVQKEGRSWMYGLLRCSISTMGRSTKFGLRILEDVC